MWLFISPVVLVPPGAMLAGERLRRQARGKRQRGRTPRSQPRATVKTQDLISRDWQLNDSPQMFEIYSRPGMIQVSGPPIVMKDAETTHERIRRYRTYQPPGSWAIVVDSSGAAACSVPPVTETVNVLQIGWYLPPDSTLHSFATEATSALLAYVFERGFRRVLPSDDVANRPSHRICVGLRRMDPSVDKADRHRPARAFEVVAAERRPIAADAALPLHKPHDGRA